MVKFLIVFLFFISCNPTEKNKYVQISEDSHKIIPKDTVIIYDIEGISSEGTEAVVTYKNKKIYESKINIYGETGQAKLIYKFLSKNIEITENRYVYKGDIESVNDKNDLILANSIKYNIDYTGKILSNNPKDYIDVFKEFKESVPFELK
ncbi:MULTISPECIES: hypothetical protein [Chryseobacterium]|uniref:Uncharacterized protein n=1 Tax=Candidatus Chryseobacterium massiliense TaxID=204089 RepID=A0A3D9BGQ4_9FLAO|nr:MULTISPECIES: hypothetical protein [Chryseobacterium]REC52551.1 hypothetical protein DRF68_02175 [Candidatus Chryseobacterium massiliae]